MGLEETESILAMQHGSDVPLRQCCGRVDRAELIQCTREKSLNEHHKEMTPICIGK